MKSMISNSLDDIKLRRENESRKIQANEDSLKAEFNKRYNENVKKLESTGIVKIFEEMIENEVVVFKPKREETVEERNYNIFLNRGWKEVKKTYPKELAYISWGKNPLERGCKSCMDLEDPYNFRAEVSLNFDGHKENVEGELYDIPVVRFLEVSYKDGDVFSMNHKDIRLDISKEELIQKVGQEIIKIKSTDSPTKRIW